MDRRFLELDALLDEVQALVFDSEPARRQQWQRMESLAWLYHELQLEGVAARREDIDRARADAAGTDYCDRELLAQIRRADALLKQVRCDALDGRALSVGQVRGWQAQLSGEHDVRFRGEEGATEHYKHDVVPPEEVLPALTRLVEASQGAASHPLESASSLLYNMGKVWPFAHWSGACARLSASMQLMAQGYPPLVIPARERMHFYQAYHYDPTRMRALFMQCVEGMLQMKKAILEGRERQDGSWVSAI